MQLLFQAQKPFDREGWLFELKYDGFRVLALKEGQQARLVSRQGSELGAAFPEIVGELATLPDCALDGELVVLDQRGIPQFDALAARSRKSTRSSIAAAARQTPAALLAFDLLAENDTDLRKLPLIERKRRLSALLRGLRRVKAVEYVEGNGRALFSAVEKLGLEGIVAKRADSIYRRGRSSDWLKIRTEVGIRKTEERGDSWYGGPGPETLARRAARAASNPGERKKRTSPEHGGRACQNQAALEAVRSAASDSVTVAVDGEAVTLTHLNRALWPRTRRTQPCAVTKRDYLAYLLEVAPYMLPHLMDRPLTLFVYPKGIGGPRSVEMHWKAKPPPWMKTVQIYSSNSKHDHTYWLCNNTASLLWLGNAGVIEFHPWHSRLDPYPDAEGRSTKTSGSAKNVDESLLNYPDYVFFDLDPYVYSGREEKGAEPEYTRKGFERCRQAAMRLRDLLMQMSLTSFVKTSGKTGLHVVVPIIRTIDFEAAREISREVFRHLLREAPEDFTMNQQVRSRSGKTFLDANMNRRASSMAAPYTPRAVQGGWVSMPIAWDELEHIEPPDFRLDTALARLKSSGDTWRDLLQRKQELGAKRLEKA